MTPAKSPVPQEVSDELQRVVERWHQLPLDHASSGMPRVRELIDALAGCAVPDLGPGVVMDQLTVVVYDACEASRREDLDDLGDLAARLGQLRRTLP